MGMKGKSGLAFCVPFLGLSVSMSSSVWAQEGMCVMPTGSGQELAYPENWNSPIVLNLHVDGLEDGAIPSGGCAVVKVDSGGWGKPPYAWEILGGESFYFNIGGVHTQTAQTPGDYQAVQLCINSESCGTATIRISDDNGKANIHHVPGGSGGWSRVSQFINRCTVQGNSCQSCYWYGCTDHAMDCTYNNSITETIGDVRWIISFACQCLGWPSGTWAWCENGEIVDPEEAPPMCSTPEDCVGNGCNTSNICMADTATKLQWMCFE